MEVTEDLFDIDGSAPNLVFEDPASEFYGLTAIAYQGGIIKWLQREYGDHVEVDYILYEEYLTERNEGLPRATRRASLRSTPPKLSHKTYCAQRHVVPP